MQCDGGAFKLTLLSGLLKVWVVRENNTLSRERSIESLLARALRRVRCPEKAFLSVFFAKETFLNLDLLTKEKIKWHFSQQTLLKSSNSLWLCTVSASAPPR
jgi:hypothetical protein